MGKKHDLEYWPSPHNATPPLDEQLGRMYDPAELFPTEGWIVRVFEPIREQFFAGNLTLDWPVCCCVCAPMM